MLDSQKTPGPRNEDYGRNRQVRFVNKSYTSLEAAMMESLYCNIEGMTFPDGPPVKATESWAKMARKEGHRSNLPPAPSPQNGAKGGKISKRSDNGETRDAVAKAVGKVKGQFTCGDIAKKTKCNSATVNGWLLKMVGDGDIRRLKKTKAGYLYEVA